MRTSIVPATCSVALAIMSAAVLSHWWSVRGFVCAVETNTLALAVKPTVAPDPSIPAKPAARPAATRPAAPVLVAKTPESQQEFYTTLLDEMKQLKRENTALRNQMAETNRDVMNLEFRVDTHSSQFRPLRVEEQIDEPQDLTEPPIIDDGPGVLPPRPEIVGLPGDE
jgi:hypothetical protein